LVGLSPRVVKSSADGYLVLHKAKGIKLRHLVYRTQVTESFRRTRWTKGQAFVWLGVQKKTGRGERSSGLAFDAIVDTKFTGNK